MDKKASGYLYTALILSLVCLLADDTRAQELQTKKDQQKHACMVLSSNQVERSRKSARQLKLDKAKDQLWSFSNRLGRDAEFQATLACLMRSQANRRQ